MIILHVKTVRTLAGEIVRILMSNKIVEVCSGTSMIDMMRQCFDINLRGEMPHSDDDLFVIAKVASDQQVLSVMEPLSQLANTTISIYTRPSDIVPARYQVANQTALPPKGAAPKGLSPREEIVPSTPDGSISITNTTASTVGLQDTIKREDNDEDEDSDEEDYLYLPDDEDEAYRKAMEDVERRYAVNNEMFVGENYVCRKCHLVLGGTDKEESELENQIILAKEHVLNEHLVFRRYKCGDGNCITRNFAWRDLSFLRDHIANVHEQECDIMDFWNTSSDLELEKTCLECFPHMFTKGTFLKMDPEMERPRLVINEDDARTSRWPPVVEIKGERDEDDDYRFSDDDSKSVANSEALEVSAWTATIMTPSPTKNEADKINSSGSAKARARKTSRPSKAIQESKDCGKCGRTIRNSKKLQLSHIMSQHYEKKRFSCNFCAYTATDRKYVKSHSRDVHRSDPDDCFTDHWSPKMELDLEELVAAYFKGKASPIAPSPDFPSNRRIVRLSDPNCSVKNPAIRLPKSRGSKVGVPSSSKAAKGDSLRRTSRVAKPKKQFIEDGSESANSERLEKRGRKRSFESKACGAKSACFCKMCDQQLVIPEAKGTRTGYMMLHVLHHMEKSFGCPRCDYMAKHAINIEKHLKSKHNDEVTRAVKLVKYNIKEEQIRMAKECFGDYFIPPTGQRGRCPSGMKNEKDKEKETKETKRKIKLPIKPRQKEVLCRSGSSLLDEREAEMNAIVKSERTEESDEDEDSQDSHDSDEDLEERAPKRRRFGAETDSSGDEQDENKPEEILEKEKSKQVAEKKAEEAKGKEESGQEEMKDEEMADESGEIVDDPEDEDYKPEKD
ncbi:hypothetical protein WR25_25826 [Diploscapter pachys]|uniref:C2H2-type domain-containing protein n=1 Tax=Diploscapter pachys TaxID=2018661 RepID=A0A2A2JLY0_9BILA|nr:hypothetical protein WR25_25826 [Diploscapter pachys]